MASPRKGSEVSKDGLGRERETLEHEFTPEETALVKEQGRTLVSDILNQGSDWGGGLSNSKRGLESKFTNSSTKSDSTNAGEGDDVGNDVNEKQASAATSAEALLVQHRIDTLTDSGNKSYDSKSFIAAIADFKQVFIEIERSSPNLDMAKRNISLKADLHWKVGEMYEEMLNLPLAMDHYCDSLAVLKECKGSDIPLNERAALDEKIGTVLSSMGRLQNKLGNYEYALELHNAAFGVTSPVLLSQSRSFKRRLKFSESTIFSVETVATDLDSIISSDSTASSRWNRRDTMLLVQDIACGDGRDANGSFSFFDCFSREIMYLLGRSDDESTIATYDSWRYERAERERSTTRQNRKDSQKGSVGSEDLGLRPKVNKTKDHPIKEYVPKVNKTKDHPIKEYIDERDDNAATATIIGSRDKTQTTSKSPMPKEDNPTIVVDKNTKFTASATEKAVLKHNKHIATGTRHLHNDSYMSNDL